MFDVDVMSTPGANMSTQEPKLENAARVSVRSVAPTLTTPNADAGEPKHASRSSFPAATATKIPSSTARVEAAFTAASSGPPRLMLSTAGSPDWWSATTQSSPATRVSEVMPVIQLNTRTGVIETPLATPHVVDPRMPETWVPCPMHPSSVEFSPVASKPMFSRPVNSGCAAVMPVSTTYAVTPEPSSVYEYS